MTPHAAVIAGQDAKNAPGRADQICRSSGGDHLGSKADRVSS